MIESSRSISQAASSQPRRIDRRVRRTQAALQKSLIELAGEKDYSAITIDDLTNRADVARATFYAHYADKQALLMSIVVQLVDDLAQNNAPLAPGSLVTRGEVALNMFRHAEQNRAAYRLVMSGAGDPPAYERLTEALVNVTETIIGRRAKNLGVHPQMPLSVLARIWIGEHIALLNWWLLGDAPYTVEQLALMRMRYHVYGPEWAHGIEPGEWVFDESLFGPEAEVSTSKPARPGSRTAGAQPNRRSASSR